MSPKVIEGDDRNGSIVAAFNVSCGSRREAGCPVGLGWGKGGLIQQLRDLHEGGGGGACDHDEVNTVQGAGQG